MSRSRNRSRTRKTKRISNDEQFEIDFGSNRPPINEKMLLQSLKIDVKCKTENQKALINSVKDNIFTIVNGLAGTGKTFLACAEALRLMVHDEKIKKMVLVKSITPLKGEDIGSLPGEIKDKMGPIMESFMDNIKKIVGVPMTEKLLEFGFIEVLPIAFARGRSIDNAVIIIDEAQNISIDNIRTLMTRIGTDSKVVILGDVKQKDIRNKKDSSLGVVLERFRNVEGFGCIELRSKEDVIRHPLIQIIDEIFDDILGD